MKKIIILAVVFLISSCTQKVPDLLTKSSSNNPTIITARSLLASITLLQAQLDSLNKKVDLVKTGSDDLSWKGMLSTVSSDISNIKNSLSAIPSDDVSWKEPIITLTNKVTALQALTPIADDLSWKNLLATTSTDIENIKRSIVLIPVDDLSWKESITKMGAKITALETAPKTGGVVDDLSWRPELTQNTLDISALKLVVKSLPSDDTSWKDSVNRLTAKVMALQNAPKVIDDLSWKQSITAIQSQLSTIPTIKDIWSIPMANLQKQMDTIPKVLINSTIVTGITPSDKLYLQVVYDPILKTKVLQLKKL